MKLPALYHVIQEFVMNQFSRPSVACRKIRSLAVLCVAVAGAAAAVPAMATVVSPATSGGSGASSSVNSVARYSAAPSLFAPKVESTIAVQIYQGSIPFVGVSFIKYELQIPSAGLLNIELGDLGFPSPAASLNFALANSTNVLGVINGPGSLSYDVLSGPTTLFGYVYAAASPATNQGAYTLNVTQQQAVAPVPLPAAVWLLISGLGLAGWTGRRHRAVVATTAV
jgi:hypothetical protein